MSSPGLAATLSHRTLATPEASPRRVGEGLGACPELAEGVRALFQWKFMAPIRMHKQGRSSDRFQITKLKIENC